MPLKSEDFEGGNYTVKKQLEALGFEVEDRKKQKK